MSSEEHPEPEIQEALAAAWSEIAQGAERRMQENKEKLQELYQQENKPTLVGHVEQLTDEPKNEDELEQPSTTQQEKSVLLTDPDEQIAEALQEQEQWDELQQRMRTSDSGGWSKEKEASDLDLEAEMERDTQVTSTDNIQRDLTSSNQADSSTTTEQQTGGGETDQRDLAGTTPENEP